MEKLEKIEGVYYTQNMDLPIEERVFFVEGIVANKSDYRFATEQELTEWEEYKQLNEQQHGEDSSY